MKSFLLSVVLLWVASPGVAQEKTPATVSVYRWISAGPAVSMLGDALSILFDANQSKNNRQRKIALGWHEEFAIFAPSMFSFGEAGFLIGRARTRNATHLSVMAGLGIVAGKKLEELGYNTSYESKLLFSPSVPLRAEVLINPGGLGIGVSVYANLNFEAKLGGGSGFHRGWQEKVRGPRLPENWPLLIGAFGASPFAGL